MKYFSVVRALKLGSTIVPGLDGKNVKNKNDFFGLEQKACGPNRFYDKNYEFDFLLIHKNTSLNLFSLGA